MKNRKGGYGREKKKVTRLAIDSFFGHCVAANFKHTMSICRKRNFETKKILYLFIYHKIFHNFSNASHQNSL